MADKKNLQPNHIATNRKALHFYNILETYEAGIELKGHEVKSIREGRVDLRDSYARVDNGEVYLYDMHISPYTNAALKWKINLKRKRRLLLHKQEIKRLLGKVSQRGFTLVPLELFFVRGWVKVKLSLAKGKKTYDRRERIKKRIAVRELQREMKSRR